MAVETVIYTIRHARTSYNAEKRYAGSIDVSLNERGVEESRGAAEILEKMGIQFDVVVTSAKKRSIETAHLLLNSGVPYVESKLCNERNFGVMEGHTWEEVQQFDPPILFISVGDDLHSVNPEGAEHFEDLWYRARRFRSFLFRNFKGKRILVVSHGTFLQMFHALLRGSSCIEALAGYPSNLELFSFRFLGDRLVEEQSVKLVAEKSTF